MGGTSAHSRVHLPVIRSMWDDAQSGPPSSCRNHAECPSFLHRPAHGPIRSLLCSCSIMWRRVLFPPHSWDAESGKSPSWNRHRRRATINLPYWFIGGFWHFWTDLIPFWTSLFPLFLTVFYTSGNPSSLLVLRRVGTVIDIPEHSCHNGEILIFLRVLAIPYRIIVGLGQILGGIFLTFLRNNDDKRSILRL